MPNAEDIADVPILSSLQYTSSSPAATAILPSALATVPATNNHQLSGSHNSPMVSGSAFRFSTTAPPIPAKLANKVRSLQFVDLKDFLPDNISVFRSMEKLDSPQIASFPTSARPKFREVNSLLTWVTCFSTYVAILASSHPHLVQSRLAYMSIIIREARKNGGDGWKAYDTIFRQNAAEDPTADWSRLDSSLHATTFIADRGSSTHFCRLCCDSDHDPKDCALYQFSSGNQFLPSRNSYRERNQRFSNSTIPLCLSWNRGNCAKAPNCRYRHVCATCPGSHPAYQCPATPPDSFFKRRGGNRPLPSNSS